MPKSGSITQAAGSRETEEASLLTESKLAALIAMLRRNQGATLEELVTETSWQTHSVRGTMSGALKRRFKLNITNDKVEKRGRVYRIA